MMPQNHSQKQQTVKRLLDERASRTNEEQLSLLDSRVGPTGAKKERARLAKK